MKFSVVASFSGSDLDEWVPCDTTISDAIDACGYIDEHWDPSSDVSEPGDSEYSYLALESCTCKIASRRVAAAQRLLDRYDDLEDEFRYRWIAEHKHDPENSDCSSSGFWDRLQDCTVSGIVDRGDFEAFIERLGAWAADVQTLGTLGGPLSLGIVPDVSFTVESQYLISFIRVTPIPELHGEPCNGAIRPERTDEENARLADRYFEALRAGMLARYGL